MARRCLFQPNFYNESRIHRLMQSKELPLLVVVATNNIAAFSWQTESWLDKLGLPSDSMQCCNPISHKYINCMIRACGKH